MRALLFVSFVVAAASAGYAPYYHGQAVIGPDGHPVETPEVQHAKAAHFASHIEARSRVHAVPYVPTAHYGIAPGISHDGRPLDTPEVAAAKIQHYHDYAVAAQRNAVPAGHGILGHYAVGSPYPIDTPEVQHAKAAHFAAHAQAAARAHGLVHYRRRRGIYAYPQHIPVIDHNGVPVETPEVQAAKAFHLAKHAEASARSGHYAYAPQVHSIGYPASLPIIAHNGVPLDTPEVAAAKAHHFAAHHKAAAKVGAVSPLLYAASYHLGGAVIGPDGRPVETPEVQHAKAAHFAAHAAARHHY